MPAPQPSSHHELGEGAPRIDIEVDRQTRVTSGRIRGHSRRSLASLVEESDPQQWSRSRFFRQSYKVLEEGGHYLPDPSPPPVGRSWRGHLFEEFEWQLGPLRVCRFQNILNIDYQVQDERIRLDYSLRRPLQGVVWFSSTPVGVDVDCGYLEVTPTASGSSFDIVKKIRFIELERARPVRRGGRLVSAFLNQCAGPTLRYWLRQAASPWLR
jgi:hypothetical protein